MFSGQKWGCYNCVITHYKLGKVPIKNKCMFSLNDKLNNNKYNENYKRIIFFELRRPKILIGLLYTL